MKNKYIFLLINLFICGYGQAQIKDSTKPAPVVRKSAAEIKQERIDKERERKLAAKEREMALKAAAKERKAAAAARLKEREAAAKEREQKSKAMAKEREQKKKDLAKERAAKANEKTGANNANYRTAKATGGGSNAKGIANPLAVRTSILDPKTNNKIVRSPFKNYDAAQVERNMNFEKDPIFDNAKQSEKNKKEAAVILAYSVLQELEQNQVKITTHKKIQLNSKGAVDELSDFRGSFIGKGNENQIFVKVIKPNGTKEYVNFLDAKVDSTLLSWTYKDMAFNLLYRFDFKVAIPNLEVGDIVEIGTSKIKKDKIYRQASEYGLKQNFPIEHLQYKFVSPKAYKIICKPTNTNISPIVDTMSAKNSIVFNATDIPKVKSEKWKRSRLQEPFFNIVFEDETINDKIARPEEIIAKNTSPKKNSGKKVITKKTIKYKYKTYLSDDERTTAINRMCKEFLTNANLKIGNDLKETKLKTDYLPTSSRNAENYKETILLYYYNLFRNYKIQHLDDDNERTIDRISALGMMTSLVKYDIPFKLLVTNNKYAVRKQDVIDIDDLNFAVLVDEKPIYPSFGHSKLYDVNPDYEGQDFWVYDYDKDTKKFQLDSTKVFTQVIANYNAHTQSDNYTIKVDKEFKNLLVSDKAARTGQFSSGMRGYLFGTKDTIPEVVIDEMLKSLGVNYTNIINFKKENAIGAYAATEKVRGANRGFYKEHLARIKEEKSNYEQKYFYNTLKDMLNDEYGTIDTLHSYKTTVLGLQPDEKGLQYEATFELENRITETPNGYIVYLGSVIGSQAEIAFEEKKRESDVYFVNQRKLENAITFEVPQGYKVSSLDDFNMKVENEFGSFVSTARQSGNQIIINTTKIYKVNYLEKKDWDKIMAMLDAAYNFTQKKIVLTR